ncbi:hypothetical protein [Burkholderia sp. Tr-860]|nr:hypothetical protein [Burkholderia sp. Tr-860]
MIESANNNGPNNWHPQSSRRTVDVARAADRERHTLGQHRA